MKKTKNRIAGVLAGVFLLVSLANLFMTVVLVRYFFLNPNIFDSSQGSFAMMMLFTIFIFCLFSVFLTRTYWQAYNGTLVLRWPTYASSAFVLLEVFLLLAGLRLI